MNCHLQEGFPTKIVQVYVDIAYQAWFLQAQLAHLEHNALAQVSTVSDEYNDISQISI